MITHLSDDLRTNIARLADAGGAHSVQIAVQAADLCVGAFADLCAIYLRSSGAQSAAFASRNPERFEAFRSLPYDDLLAQRVRAAGVTKLIEEPLMSQGRRIGTLIVGFAGPEAERLVPSIVVELIASVLARAIEQAEELEHHYLISKRLQNALLPARLVSASDVTFDAAYRPANDESDVGGDWYDAFDIGEGKIGISVGDVTGHGLEAAVAMSEIRRAIRAAAAISDSPSKVLNQVDAIVCADGIGMATALVGVYDTATGVLRYASAGHPAPIVLIDGTAQLLPAGGLLLGLGMPPASEDYWVTLSPGSTCFFYTDGLLEYDRDVIAGEAALLAAIERIGQRGELSAEALHREIFTTAVNSDDCATLSLQRSEATDSRNEHLVFSALPMCAPLARHALRHFCERNGLDEERRFHILTGAGEAVANAIEHGNHDVTQPFTIEASVDADVIRLTIENHGHWRTFTAREERGRGIPMMRWCSSSLEISSAHDRTRIRLTFPL